MAVHQPLSARGLQSRFERAGCTPAAQMGIRLPKHRAYASVGEKLENEVRE